jgi:hypothetical protein
MFGPMALFQINNSGTDLFSRAELEFEKVVIYLELPMVGGIQYNVPTDALD